MKKASIQTAFLALANLFLLASLFVACQKEGTLPTQGVNNLLFQYDTTTGVRYVLSGQSETHSSAAEDRGGIEGFPFSDGNCRVLFRVRDFDPNNPGEGVDAPPCDNSHIVFKGYSQPNGQGTLLFSTGMLITGDWQEFTIPTSAYIIFVIESDQVGDDPECRFKFFLADYGWNRSALTWINIPRRQWLPVITGRFAPKDHVTGSYGYHLFDEYLCDSWCTWTVPVYFENYDPYPDPWITAKLVCYSGYDALPYQGLPGDARIIKSYFLTDNYNKTLYFYPISEDINQYYRTEAADTNTPDPYDVITYDVFGPDHQGAGSFSYWVVAPYPISTVGKCNVDFQSIRDWFLTLKLRIRPDHCT